MAAALRNTLIDIQNHRQSQLRGPAASDMAYCSNCGNPTQSKSRIDELENMVRVLTEQSVDALTRLADYEEEIRKLKSQKVAALPTPATTPIEGMSPPQQHSHNGSVDSATSSNSTTSASSAGYITGGYGLNFASFRMGAMGRKPSVAASTPSTAPSTAPSLEMDDLQKELLKEQAARQEAETKADKLSSELEDLSATLFEQANTMVSTERRARSKLEERVAMLEKRDKEKSRRLAKIEGALHRLERVKTLLAPPSPPY